MSIGARSDTIANQISVVVPVFNEAENLRRIIETLQAFGISAIVVVDGGSQDNSVDVARNSGALVVQTSLSRGRQVGAGVVATQSDIIWVLHADSHFVANPVAEILAACQKNGAGALALKIDAVGLSYRLIELGVWLRNRLWHLPYGDQGCFFLRSVYDAAGGYPDIPIMEDVSFALAAKRQGTPLRTIKSQIVTDARRWQRDGVWRRTMRNLWLLFRYVVLRHDAKLLALAYQPESDNSLKCD